MRRFATGTLFLVYAFALRAAHPQQAARHSVEIAAVGRETTNNSRYIYPTNAPSYFAIDRQIFGGAVVGYSYALSPGFALEARAGYIFGHQPQNKQSGGEQITAHAGVRASIPFGHSRFSVYGRIAPGVSSFSNGVRSQNFTLVTSSSGIYTYIGTPNYDRLTHFSLEDGVGLSVALSPRTSLNFDVGHEVMLTGDRAQTLPGQGFSTIVEAATTEDHDVYSIGLRRSFGKPFATPALPRSGSEASKNAAPSSELIVSYALQPTPNVTYSPAQDLAVDAIPPPTGPNGHFGGDVGGVLEIYPTRNFVLRFDAAETLIHFGAVTPVSGYGTNYVAAGGESVPQFLLGAGWRF